MHQLEHVFCRHRAEGDGDDTLATGAPGWLQLEQVGAGHGDDEDGSTPPPVGEVLDEIDEGRIRPVQVLENEHRGSLFSYCAEESTHRGIELGTIPWRFPLAEHRCQPRSHPSTVARIRHLSVSRVSSSPAYDRLIVVPLRDSGASLDHLRDGPESDTLAIGQRPAFVPSRIGVHQPINVL